MKGVKVILFILFLLGIKLLLAQNRAELDSISHQYQSAKTDTSRILILSDWSRKIFNANPDSSLLLARKGLQLSEKLNFIKGIGRTKYNISYCYNKNGKSDSALILLNESINYAKKTNDILYLGLINVNYGNYYYLKGQYNHAISYFNTGISYFNILKNKVEIGKVYSFLGIMYVKKGEFAKALYYYNLNAAICEETKDINALSISYINFGVLANAQGNSNKALEYFFSALTLIEKNNNKRLLSITYNNIGDIYRYMNQTDKALEYFQKSLKVTEETGDKSSIGAINENIGLIYFKSKPPKFKRALSYLLKGLTVYQESDDINSMTGIHTTLIEIYIALKDYSKASEMLKKGLELSKEVESNEIKAELHRAASEYYFATKAYSKAFEQSRLGIQFARKAENIPVLISNLKQNSTVADKLNLYKEAYYSISEYNELKDSIQSETEKKNLFLKEFQYKEANLKLEQLKKEMILKKESEKRKWIYSGIVLGLLCLFFYAIIISRNLKKQKKYSKDLNEINSTKDKLFSIISHDLRNPFNSILGFSELLMNNIEEIDPEKVKKISASLYQSSKSTYDLLGHLLEWSALQSNKIAYTPEKIDLKALIVGNIEMVTPLATQKQIQIMDYTDDSQSVFADQNMLNSVIRNLLTNAIKFTFTGGKIEISSTIKDHMLFLSIKDNGQGMDGQKMKDLFNFGTLNSSKGTNNESGTGLGLILCKEFIEKNKGELYIESEEGKGSNFILSVPIIA